MLGAILKSTGMGIRRGLDTYLALSEIRQRNKEKELQEQVNELAQYQNNIERLGGPQGMQTLGSSDYSIARPSPTLTAKTPYAGYGMMERGPELPAIEAALKEEPADPLSKLKVEEQRLKNIKLQKEIDSMGKTGDPNKNVKKLGSELISFSNSVRKNADPDTYKNQEQLIAENLMRGPTGGFPAEHWKLGQEQNMQPPSDWPGTLEEWQDYMRMKSGQR